MDNKTKNFIEKAQKVHNDKYDYSKVEYINNHTKICIICPEHGEFWQRPNSHLNGNGCPECGKNITKAKKTSSKENFIEKAQKVHGNKYDYSKVEYTKAINKVEIICPEHGSFFQSPHSHLNGCGCPKCGDKSAGEKNALTKESFIEKTKLMHGNKYDYSKVEYVNAHTKVIIICPEHGEFEQFPMDHIKGKGCPLCGYKESSLKQVKTQEDFIKDAQKIHGEKYIYENTKYVNDKTLVEIMCPKHGVFFQRPNNHLRGQGCPYCGREEQVIKQTLTTEEFINRAKDIHGDRYDYSKVKYKGIYEKVCIICPEHGEFMQTPDGHLANCGCPSCGHIISKGESDVVSFLKMIVGDENVIIRDKIILKGKELDIYIPSKKMAIEYDGLRWHSEEFGKDRYYHLNKTLECQKQGIKLIHIFEDEWLEHPEIVKDKLRSYLELNNSPIIGARKCSIKEISNSDAEDFLNRNHIQGYSRSTIYLGAFFKDKLVSVMSFLEEKDKVWNLTRFATDNSMKFPGIASKMFKYFKEHYEYREVKSFLDLRWNWPGNTVYEKLGFNLDSIESPDYYYLVNKKRMHKFGFRKQILSKKYGLPLSMTEKEMCNQLGFYRIWNCGLAKYIYLNEKNENV